MRCYIALGAIWLECLFFCAHILGLFDNFSLFVLQDGVLAYLLLWQIYSPNN
jgi:hypothetical protein